MAHTLFISHYNGDKVIAELISNTLKRITLEQITPWSSSDENTTTGGLKPGDIWFNQVMVKIHESKAVIPLLTPNSIAKPWIYFESGIAQAIDNCEVVPVCIGLNRDTVVLPMGLYQCYQLNDHRSVVEFMKKILTLVGIKFDEGMSKDPIKKLVSSLSTFSFVKQLPNFNNKTLESMIEGIKEHIDKRFVQVLERAMLTSLEKTTSPIADNYENTHLNDKYLGYSVSFSIEFPRFKNKDIYIDIRPEDSFQDLTDTIYYMISDHVGPYKYLENWVIIEKETNVHVIIREIASRVLAKEVFRPNSKWRIVKLKRPYTATDSSKRIISLHKIDS